MGSDLSPLFSERHFVRLELLLRYFIEITCLINWASCFVCGDRLSHCFIIINVYKDHSDFPPIFSLIHSSSLNYIFEDLIHVNASPLIWMFIMHIDSSINHCWDYTFVSFPLLLLSMPLCSLPLIHIHLYY